MKRILLIVIAIMLTLSLAACGGGDGNQPAQGGNGNSGNNNSSNGNTPIGGSTDLTEKELNDAKDAFEMLEEWAKAQGWDENPYENWIYGVWDSEVLPACVP